MKIALSFALVASLAAFEIADVQERIPGGPYDLAFSRMGMMFFASPVMALRQVRAALVPGGRLCMVVWRSKEANAGLAIPEQARAIELERSDADLRFGDTLDAAVELALTLGPAGERVRLAGPHAIARRDELTAAVRASLAPFVRGDGVYAPSSTWLVTATA